MSSILGRGASGDSQVNRRESTSYVGSVLWRRLNTLRGAATWTGSILAATSIPSPCLITKAMIEIPPRFSGPAPYQSLTLKMPDGTESNMERYCRISRGCPVTMGNGCVTKPRGALAISTRRSKLPQEHGGGAATALAWLLGANQ